MDVKREKRWRRRTQESAFAALSRIKLNFMSRLGPTRFAAPSLAGVLYHFISVRVALPRCTRGTRHESGVKHISAIN